MKSVIHSQEDHPLPALETLLAGGGDARIVRDGEGRNKYGCFSVPRPDILSYSSSTASTISAAGFAACARLYARLQDDARREAAGVTYARELQRLRGALVEACGLAGLPGLELVIGASGTDLHLLLAQLLRRAESSLLVVMPEAEETGSGVPSALHGRHFSSCTAYGGTVEAGEPLTGGENIEIAVVKSRLDDGNPRPAAAVDAETEALVAGAIKAGRRVLLTLTDVSKTGLIVPSPACAHALKHRFAPMVEVLVDACQFRLAAPTLRAYLEQGFLVAVTGSKFVAGPSFSAALFVPEPAALRVCKLALPPVLGLYTARAEWPPGWEARAKLPEAANFGLLLRWEAALAEMQPFQALPAEAVRDFLETFAAAIRQRLSNTAVFEPLPTGAPERRPVAENMGWDHIPTIFPFLMRRPKNGKSLNAAAFLNRDEAARLYALLGQDLARHPAVPAAQRRLAGVLCQLGQPVICGRRSGIPVSALRLCLDMRLIVDALAAGGRGGKAVVADALRVLDKVALLAETPVLYA